MKRKDQQSNLFATIRHLIVMNVVLAGLLAGSLGLNYYLSRNQTLSIPPDLRYGAMIKPGEKYPEEVFAFTTGVFQSLNNWRTDGEADYRDNLKALSAYLTPRFVRTVQADVSRRKKSGELKGRTRRVSLPAQYIYENQAVKILSPNEWVVQIPLEVEEYVDFSPVKNIEVLYSIKVKRVRSDLAKNPWQIAIDGFDRAPIRTKDYLSRSFKARDVKQLMKEG